ncbi:unnamed protein product [Closterium sp. NIES-54]
MSNVSLQRVPPTSTPLSDSHAPCTMHHAMHHPPPDETDIVDAATWNESLFELSQGHDPFSSKPSVPPLWCFSLGPLPSLPLHLFSPSLPGETDAVGETDIVDEAITLFRANVLFRRFDIRGPADKLLVYLTLYINMALKRIDSCPSEAEGIRLLINLGLEPFPIPGDPGFPLAGLFATPTSRLEAVKPGHAHKLLLYLTLYINMALERIDSCPSEAEGIWLLINLGLDPFPIPGDPGFPLTGLFATPQVRAF